VYWLYTTDVLGRTRAAVQNSCYSDCYIVDVLCPRALSSDCYIVDVLCPRALSSDCYIVDVLCPRALSGDCYIVDVLCPRALSSGYYLVDVLGLLSALVHLLLYIYKATIEPTL
jgi:hypothetical protein